MDRLFYFLLYVVSCGLCLFVGHTSKREAQAYRRGLDREIRRVVNDALMRWPQGEETPAPLAVEGNK